MKQQATEKQIRNYQRQLRRLTSELSLAEARERQAIASDLHDHIGQALAYVSQKVGTLQGNAIFSGMEGDFAEILSILEQTIRYTRNLTVEISPPVLYELGLPSAIDWLAERSSQRHKLKVVSTQTGSPQPVADDIKVFLFKALQELVTNAAKHAHAENVAIRTAWTPDLIALEVADDGCGFDSSLISDGLSPEGCFGLFSIRERLSYAGGAVQINSAPGNGTSVTITTPYRVITGENRD
jgi:signal transduction histidine kinase